MPDLLRALTCAAFTHLNAACLRPAAFDRARRYGTGNCNSTGTGNVAKDAKTLGLEFLQSFWDGQPERGFALCAPGARWRFQRSLHDPQDVDVRYAVEWLNSRLVAGFDPASGYSVTVDNAIAEGDEAAIEYSATGRTRSGEVYFNRYLVRFTVENGAIASIRPYFDTHYVSKTLCDLG